MKLYIIRHGETDLNRKRLLQGTYNSHLNEDGKAQARECAVWLKENGIAFDRVYVSPLDRAVETAEIVTGFPREKMHLEEQITEINFGPYEMLPYEELDSSMMAYFKEPSRYPAPEGMETIDALTGRVGAFMDALAVTTKDLPSSMRAAVVTHGVAIRTIMAHLNRQTFEEGWDLMVGNCDVFYTECTDGAYTKPSRIRIGTTRNEA